MSSLASLRTRTGCLQCRKRRKKCDETRPQCTACTRNELDCEWPSGDNQPPDGRRRRFNSDRTTVRVVAPSGLSLIQLSPPVVMPAPFQSDENAYLYRYFVSTILPRLVRQSSLDQTHMLRLAPQFSPLFSAMVSVAGMQLPSTARWPIRFALQGYLHAIHSLQTSLTDITKAGCDDRVLATVILLSVFESCRSDAAPTVGPHVTAAGLLLTQRRPREFRTKAAATFDRVCVESFLYHACLMMVFDPSLDALTEDRNDLGLSLYFDKHTNQSEETILQTSYRFFLLIADVTRQSRQSRPLDGAGVLRWRRLDRELWRWTGLTSSADMTLGLCYVAVCILLQKMNPDITASERGRRVRSCLEEGLRRLPLLKIEFYPPVYLLWPVAILGAVAARPDERNIVQDFISLVVARKLGGQGAWVQKRLKRIWRTTSPASTSPEPNLAGLQSLLDGE